MSYEHSRFHVYILNFKYSKIQKSSAAYLGDYGDQKREMTVGDNMIKVLLQHQWIKKRPSLRLLKVTLCSKIERHRFQCYTISTSFMVFHYKVVLFAMKKSNCCRLKFLKCCHCKLWKLDCYSSPHSRTRLIITTWSQMVSSSFERNGRY